MYVLPLRFNLLAQTGALPMPGACMQLLMSAEVRDKAMPAALSDGLGPRLSA